MRDKFRFNIFMEVLCKGLLMSKRLLCVLFYFISLFRIFVSVSWYLSSVFLIFLVCLNYWYRELLMIVSMWVNFGYKDRLVI